MNDVLIGEEKKKRDLRVGDIVWCDNEVCIISRIRFIVSGKNIEVLSAISLVSGEAKQTVSINVSYDVAYRLENLFKNITLLAESVTLKSK